MVRAQRRKKLFLLMVATISHVPGSGSQVIAKCSAQNPGASLRLPQDVVNSLHFTKVL